MIFNWMYALCALLGVALGMEIMYLVMKYRVDQVAEEICKLRADLLEVLEANSRILGRWDETIKTLTDAVEFIGTLIDQNGKRRG